MRHALPSLRRRHRSRAVTRPCALADGDAGRSGTQPDGVAAQVLGGVQPAGESVDSGAHARPRALFISALAPWPLGSGSTRRLEAIVTALADTHDVDLFVPAPPAGTLVPAGVSILPIDWVPFREDRLHWRYLRWLTRWTVPMLTLQFSDPSRQVRAVLAGGTYDLVWVFRAELAASIRRTIAGVPAVVDADDNEIEKIDTLVDQESRILKRAFLLEQRRRYSATFRRLVRRGLVLCFSAGDGSLPSSCHGRFIRNGLADPGYLPPSVRAPTPGTAAFLGLLQYPPNRVAAVEAATRILPLLREVNPASHLHVIGKDDVELRRLLEATGAHVLGFVPDLDKALMGVTAMLVPLRTGSGTSVKTIEALARGIPVISTEFGVRGLGLMPDRHYIRAESPEEFARAWSDLLSDYPTRADAMASAGRLHYELHFSPGAVRGDVQDAALKAKVVRR